MSNVDPEEIARFDAIAARWWDADGEMRPLHDLNPVRLGYVERERALDGSEVLGTPASTSDTCWSQPRSTRNRRLRATTS